MRKCIAILSIIAIPVLFLSCHSGGESSKVESRSLIDSPKTFDHWISWNLLFTTSTAADSLTIIKKFESYLSGYVTGQDASAKLTFNLHYCPCDKFLTNLDATLVTGSGKPVQVPPNQPNPGPSGDYTLGNNFDMSIPSSADPNDIYQNVKQNNVKFVYSPSAELVNKTLAVIDTGLDTVMFKKAYPNTIWFGNLLWQGPKGKTLFDVYPGENENVLMDHGIVRHGTAATAIILTQMSRIASNRIPKIMSIRAFNDAEEGSIYTVSCALSYAIQQHADFINASWGYYGPKDPVLKKYLMKASEANIRIIAAAGNTRGTHDPNLVCSSTVNDANNLELFKKDTLFYPASFAPDIPNLVSVTEMHSLSVSPAPLQLVPCFYQNFSSKYITVGAFEIKSKITCCEFSIPFLNNPIEGSSFATPVITGKLMIGLNKIDDIKLYINNHSQVGLTLTGLPNSYTNKGEYISFVIQ
jgi:hypothetical protein